MAERSLDVARSAATLNAERPIARAGAPLTAFVGRTLRGPLNRATIVRSFADFQQEFGGLWQASPLSYAVEHFFEQGGRQAAIVRVANGCRIARGLIEEVGMPRAWLPRFQIIEYLRAFLARSRCGRSG